MKKALRRLDEEEDPAIVTAVVLADEGKTAWIADATKILDVEFVPILSKLYVELYTVLPTELHEWDLLPPSADAATSAARMVLLTDTTLLESILRPISKSYSRGRLAHALEHIAGVISSEISSDSAVLLGVSALRL